MGLTITNLVYGISGNRKTRRFNVAFDGSYPTGGESLVASDIGLVAIEDLRVDPKIGYIFEYDYSTEKLKAYTPRAAISNTLAVNTPVLPHPPGPTAVTSTAATMPDHAVMPCMITGDAGVAAGAGAEVADSTNLSSVRDVVCYAIGY